MKTNIRKAQAADISALQQISRQVIDQSYRSFLGDKAVDEFIGGGSADAYIAEMIDNTTVILLDGEIAGMCICKDDLVDLLMVDSRFQCRGLGKTLLDHVLKGIFENNAEARLESFEENREANAFYEKNGWEIVKIDVDETFGIRKIYYRKQKCQ